MRKIKRRKFIKDTLIAGAGAVVVPKLLSAETLQPAAKKIIVAGAGITGLCCAYELMKAGHQVVVLEASGRYGGHVFTGRDGLSDGLYADYGADHITKPGYERFFDYIEEFKLTAIPYPNAEGSEYNYDKDALKMIGGKFYTAEQLKDPAVLTKFGFNDKEVKFLSEHPMYELGPYYIKPYLSKFTDAYQPFGVGYDDLDKIPISEIFKKEGASSAALKHLGGHNTSALYYLWRTAIMNFRKIPYSEGETFHLKDGNEQLPVAFAKRLGERLKLNSPVTAIKQSKTEVRVSYRPYGAEKETELNADFVVNCITLPIFKNIPVTPPPFGRKAICGG
jgi:monoamine oxidase